MKKIITTIMVLLYLLAVSAFAQSTSSQNLNDLDSSTESQIDSLPSADTINQADQVNSPVDTSSSKSNENEDFWQWIKGTPQQNSVYLGMFTLHFSPGSIRDDNWNNELIGGTYKGIFVGTLVNSFYNRAYVAGFSRDLYKNQVSENLDMTTGYRLGLITGYTLDMNEFTSHLPALPFVQAYVDFTYRNIVGIEFSYVGIVVTTEFYLRF
ncbi:hypothetical protein L3V82_06710 [Thiotrichales bacterium 19S3-7]|nr:hypothetical protein [Thiotrichales bacterium 19S3-7]MCF6801789.1 hypothetical protein [Thiotrichales bacterium 19S3-11]